MLFRSVAARWPKGGMAGTEAEKLANGDVVELIGFIRNQGRGVAHNVTFYCSLDGILVGTGMISILRPGDLKMAVCDLQLMGGSGVATFIVEIDGTNSIDEAFEDNNLLEVPVPIKDPEGASDGGSRGMAVAMASLLLVVGSLAAFQLGPQSVKKGFERRK